MACTCCVGRYLHAGVPALPIFKHLQLELSYVTVYMISEQQWPLFFLLKALGGPNLLSVVSIPTWQQVLAHSSHVLLSNHEVYKTFLTSFEVREVISKTCASCFIGFPNARKHLNYPACGLVISNVFFRLEIQ